LPPGGGPGRTGQHAGGTQAEGDVITGIEAIAGPGARDYLGEAVTPEQTAAFEALPFARDAVAVRRWDDEAKDPAVAPPAFAHFGPLLGGLIRS
jgi:hypothetical protein